MPLKSNKNKSVVPVRQPVNSPLLETIKHSVAMGAGMSIGQRLVGSVMGTTPSAESAQIVAKQMEKCNQEKEYMDQCMKYSEQDSPCYEELRSYVHCVNRSSRE